MIRWLGLPLPASALQVRRKSRARMTSNRGWDTTNPTARKRRMAPPQVVYYDQRIRKEGFDIEHRMAAAGMIPTESAAQHLAANPSPPEGLNA